MIGMNRTIAQHMKLFETRKEITKFVTDSNGVRKSALAWCRILGIQPSTIYKRMQRTDDPDVILDTTNLQKPQDLGEPNA